jgi:hypothetical protein
MKDIIVFVSILLGAVLVVSAIMYTVIVYV